MNCGQCEEGGEGGGDREEPGDRLGLGRLAGTSGWMRKVASAKPKSTKITKSQWERNLNNDGEETVRWLRDCGSGVKGTKGIRLKTATDEKTMDDGRGRA